MWLLSEAQAANIRRISCSSTVLRRHPSLPFDVSYPMHNDDLSEQLAADTGLFISATTPSKSDPLPMILRSHLLIEEMLREYLDRKVAHPSALSGARFTFAQILAIARALAGKVPVSNWKWVAVEKLNSLRNQLAHRRELQKVDDAIDELVSYIEASSTIPIGRPEGDAAYVRAAVLQVALMALYTVLSDHLGFDAAKRLTEEQARAKELAADPTARQPAHPCFKRTSHGAA